MNNKHPYINYAEALVRLEHLDGNIISEIENSNVLNELNTALSFIRVQPIESFNSKEKIKYGYVNVEKGNPKNGIFLSPNVIATDLLIGNTLTSANNLIKNMQSKNLLSSEDATMSISPLSGEFLSFSTKGNIGRGKPKSTLLEMGLSMVTTLTPYKPCMQDRGDNTCIIPDLSLECMIDFIRLFKDMLLHNSSQELFIGRVKAEESGKGANKKITYKPIRPLLFSGNFPNPPKSTSLGAVALLATIGEFCKKAEYSERAQRVIDSLKDTTIYMIKYGDAKTFTFNHHIIDLAKEGNLRKIVDSLYYSKLYSEPKRDYQNVDYQKYDLFTSRFLQLFNQSAFKDFLSFRAEYPAEVKLLLNTYFEKMEKIDPNIVASARQLGRWLNSVAYFTAKREVKEGSQNEKEKIRELKAKVLIELESSSFSAKSGDAMIAQVVTRAGRLSGMDAPNEGALFMEKTISGELPLEQAKNLIIAFSRLKNQTEEKEDVNKIAIVENNEVLEHNNYQDS